MATPPPAGYLNRKIAESVQEAVARYTSDHIKSITKAAIQEYIDSFLNTKGGNRELFSAITKSGLQYITDKSFDPESDTTLRKVQLARFFEQIHRELPTILIMDTAFEIVPSNFTGIDAAYIENGFWYGTMAIVRRLQISVVAGTRDQSTTDIFHSLLSVLFGEMRFISGGTFLRGNHADGETWVINMGPPSSLNTVTKEKVSDDPKDTIYLFNLDLPNIIFEDRVTVRQPMGKFGGGQGNMNPEGAELLPIIYAPSTIPIDETGQVRLKYFQPLNHNIIINDPNIATYEPKDKTIHPRRLGTFELQILEKKKPLDGENVGSQTGATQKVIARVQIKVTPN